MSHSRQNLYRHGEPFGDSATRRKLGGGYVCGGGGDSNSSQATSNYDQRVAVQDGIGFSGSSNNRITSNTTSNTAISVTDGGIVSRGLDTVDRAYGGALGSIDKTVSGAFNAINTSNATNSDGFSKLLDVTESMFARSEGLIGQTQKSVADAYAQAEANKSGSIDNRTIMVIAVAGAAALAFANRGK